MSAAYEIPASEVIDPAVDMVYAVECELHYTTYVVAASEGEAEAEARDNRHDDQLLADWDFYGRAVEKVGDRDAHNIPWGASYYRGKQVTVAEAIEIIKEGPAGVGEVSPGPNLKALKPDPQLDGWLKAKGVEL